MKLALLILRNYCQLYSRCQYAKFGFVLEKVCLLHSKYLIAWGAYYKSIKLTPPPLPFSLQHVLFDGSCQQWLVHLPSKKSANITYTQIRSYMRATRAQCQTTPSPPPFPFSFPLLRLPLKYFTLLYC